MVSTAVSQEVPNANSTPPVNATDDEYDSAIDDYYGASEPQQEYRGVDEYSLQKSLESHNIQDSPDNTDPIAPTSDPQLGTSQPAPYVRHVNYLQKNPHEEQINFSSQPSNRANRNYYSVGARSTPETREYHQPNGSHFVPSDNQLQTGSQADAAAAMMAQEVSAVQTLKRLSIGALSALDPDLPNYREEMFRTSGDGNTSQSNASQKTKRESLGFDFSNNRPSRSLSAPSTPTSSRLLRGEAISGPAKTDANATGNSQLLWVPAHVHPEISPQQWQSFVQDKLAEIKSSQEQSHTKHSSQRGNANRSNSLSSISGLQRRNTRLSRQFKDQESYTDGADVLEKRRSADSSINQPCDPSIESLSHQLETLGELEGWSVDPNQLNNSSSDKENAEDPNRQTDNQAQASQQVYANDSDSPIFSAPTSALRRSTRTHYNKSSIKRGRRDPIERAHSALTSASNSTSNTQPSQPQATEEPTPPPLPEKDPVVDVNKSLPEAPRTDAVAPSHPNTGALPQENGEEHADPPSEHHLAASEGYSNTSENNSPLPGQGPNAQTIDPPLSSALQRPLSPESDDDSAHSKHKGRKPAWGWLFNNSGSTSASSDAASSPDIAGGDSDPGEKSSVDMFLNRAPLAASSPSPEPEPTPEVSAVETHKSSNESRISNFFSKKKSTPNLKHRQESVSDREEELEKLSPSSSIESDKSKGSSNKQLKQKQGGNNKNTSRYRSRPQSNEQKETTASSNAAAPEKMPEYLVAYSPEAAAYYGAPYQIPAHQFSDKSIYMMNHRYAPHVERAIYRLSHLKLGNTKRPLVQQVLLSNFMYAYLNLINQGFIRQQQEALFKMQQQQQKQLELQQKRVEKDPHYQQQHQQWQERQKQRKRKQQQQQQQQQQAQPQGYELKQDAVPQNTLPDHKNLHQNSSKSSRQHKHVLHHQHNTFQHQQMQAQHHQAPYN